MYREQIEMWPEEIVKGYRLNQHLLAKGEKPDMRPWGGMFEKAASGEGLCTSTCSVRRTPDVRKA